MKIQKNNYYLYQERKTDPIIFITGLKAQGKNVHRRKIKKQYGNLPKGTYSFHDGHLPKYQPIGSEIEAEQYLKENPYSQVEPLELKEGIII
jgi:hypothetical protein